VVADIAEAARYWLRRELARESLAGTVVPRVVNPRTQAWLAGFVGAVADGMTLDAARRYELEVRLYIALFEGSPMGEQLGLEALQMTKHLQAQKGATPFLPEDYVALGADGGRHFLALAQALEGFGATLR
jgi:hypothetical protein